MIVSLHFDIKFHEFTFVDFPLRIILFIITENDYTF